MNSTQFNDMWPAAAHESWLCREAYHRFQVEGQRQINAETFGLQPTRENNIAAYSAYADFLQHLHGTYMALFEMEVYRGYPQNPDVELYVAQDNFLKNEAARLLKGDATSEGCRSAVPEKFGEDLRHIRNRTNHVGYKRVDPAAAGQLTLQEFYRQYHTPFVEVLYRKIASGYLDAHSKDGRWDAIEGFSVLAGETARKPFGLEVDIAQLGHFRTTGTSHIRLGLIDESSADLPAPEFRGEADRGYVLPILGAPPWDPNEVWVRAFKMAWDSLRDGGSLLDRLGPVRILHGPQRPQSLVLQSGSGLEATTYAIRLADSKATPEAIAANKSAMDSCVREAGDAWHADLDNQRRLLITDQNRRLAERDRIRKANQIMN